MGLKDLESELSGIDEGFVRKPVTVVQSLTESVDSPNGHEFSVLAVLYALKADLSALDKRLTELIGQVTKEG